jgi:BatD DUF11 like domain
MSMIKRYSLTAISFLLVFAMPGMILAAENRPEVLVQLDRERVYVGEPVTYQVILNHVKNPTPPDLSYLADQFTVHMTGGQPMNSSFVQIINGKRTEKIRRGIAYFYSLTAKSAGVLTIPGPSVEVDGQTIRGQALTLQVVPASLQDTVKMDITVEPAEVYPTQPFTVTLTVLVKSLPEPISGRNPLGVQSTPPMLSIPWVADNELPDGVKAKQDTRAWLNSLHNSQSGFGINRLRGSSPMSFFESRPLTFEPSPSHVMRKDAAGEMVDYWQYKFSRTFVASRIGSYTFGPTTLEGEFGTGLSGGRLEGEEIHLAASPIEIAVKQVPQANRPNGYCGAIGSFSSLESTLNPTDIRVGDPVTLTLTLEGTGSVDNISVPDLAKVPAIAKNFKTYEGTLETKGSTAKFVYTLRPLDEGVTEFPQISVAYFNTKTDSFATVESAPIAIKVTKAEKLSTSQIVGTSGGGRNANHDLQLSREGIFANKTNLDEVHDQSVRPEYWLAAIGGLGLLYLIIYFGTRKMRTLIQDKSRIRRRSAVSRARHRLNEGTKLLHSRKVEQGADEIRLAICGLLADLDDSCESGMTPGDARRKLEDFELETELVNRVGKALETCDATRYSGNGGADNLADEAGSVLDDMVHSLKNRKLLK